MKVWIIDVIPVRRKEKESSRVIHHDWFVRNLNNFFVENWTVVNFFKLGVAGDGTLAD